MLGGAAAVTLACVLYLSATGQASQKRYSPKAVAKLSDQDASVVLHERMEKLEEKAKHKHDHYEHCKDGEGDKHVSAWKR